MIYVIDVTFMGPIMKPSSEMFGILSIDQSIVCNEFVLIKYNKTKFDLKLSSSINLIN